MIQCPQSALDIRTQVIKPRDGKKVGLVRATVGGDFVGNMNYGIGPGENVVRTTQFSVDVAWQGRGVGRRLFEALVEAYPGMEIAEGGGSNTDAGNGFLNALRQEGAPYHEFDCFILVDRCQCPLGNRVRSQSAVD